MILDHRKTYVWQISKQNIYCTPGCSLQRVFVTSTSENFWLSALLFSRFWSNLLESYCNIYLSILDRWLLEGIENRHNRALPQYFASFDTVVVLPILTFRFFGHCSVTQKVSFSWLWRLQYSNSCEFVYLKWSVTIDAVVVGQQCQRLGSAEEEIIIVIPKLSILTLELTKIVIKAEFWCFQLEDYLFL